MSMLFTSGARALRRGRPLDEVLDRIFLLSEEEAAAPEAPAAEGGRAKTTRGKPKAARKTEVDVKARGQIVKRLKKMTNTEIENKLERLRELTKEAVPGEKFTHPDTGKTAMGRSFIKHAARWDELGNAEMKDRELGGSSYEHKYGRRYANIGLWKRFTGSASSVRNVHPGLVLGGLGAASLLGAYLLSRAKRSAESHVPPPPPPAAHRPGQFVPAHNPMPFPYLPQIQHPYAVGG